jgi:NADH-quinone oxidoreductase subunit A
MASNDINVFMPVVILMILGGSIVIIASIVSKIFRPHNPTKLKATSYECGELPVGDAWSMFNVRFYVVGLIFIIFDVESALMFPVVAVFKKMNENGMGGVVLVEVLIFVGILISGLAYCWNRGDLDWVKSFKKEEK